MPVILPIAVTKMIFCSSSPRQRSMVLLVKEPRKRYGLCMLDYTITSSHIHLLVLNQDKGEIAQSIQLIAGCTTSEYNQRKKRKGAFWEDYYRATAVETNDHLLRCLSYIDLNRVRAGVVEHSDKWRWSGCNEVQYLPAIPNDDIEMLCKLSGIRQQNLFQQR